MKSGIKDTFRAMGWAMLSFLILRFFLFFIILHSYVFYLYLISPYYLPKESSLPGNINQKSASVHDEHDTTPIKILTRPELTQEQVFFIRSEVISEFSDHNLKTYGKLIWETPGNFPYFLTKVNHLQDELEEAEKTTELAVASLYNISSLWENSGWRKMRFVMAQYINNSEDEVGLSNILKSIMDKLQTMHVKFYTGGPWNGVEESLLDATPKLNSLNFTLNGFQLTNIVRDMEDLLWMLMMNSLHDKPLRFMKDVEYFLWVKDLDNKGSEWKLELEKRIQKHHIQSNERIHIEQMETYEHHNISLDKKSCVNVQNILDMMDKGLENKVFGRKETHLSTKKNIICQKLSNFHNRSLWTLRNTPIFLNVINRVDCLLTSLAFYNNATIFFFNLLDHYSNFYIRSSRVVELVLIPHVQWLNSLLAIDKMKEKAGILFKHVK